MVERKSLFLADYINARKNTENKAEGEKVYPWRVFEKSVDDYEIDFGSLGDRLIHEFLEDRRSRNLQTCVLDFASGGSAVRQLAREELIVSGLSIGLTDPRSEKMREDDQFRNIEVLTGDLLFGTTWGNIKQWIKKNNNGEKADLIMCRSNGGFESYPLPVIGIFLKKAMRILHSSGMLITDYPINGTSDEIKNWICINVGDKPNLTYKNTQNYSHTRGFLVMKGSHLTI